MSVSLSAPHDGPSSLSAVDSETVRELFSAMERERQARNRTHPALDPFSAEPSAPVPAPGGPRSQAAAATAALSDEALSDVTAAAAVAAAVAAEATLPQAPTGSSWKDVVIGNDHHVPLEVRIIGDDPQSSENALSVGGGEDTSSVGHYSTGGGNSRPRRGRRRGGGGVDRGLPRYVDRTINGEFICSACEQDMPDTCAMVDHVESEDHIRSLVFLSDLDPDTNGDGDVISIAQAARYGLKPIERFCFLCDVQFSSTTDRQQHISGKKHASAVKKYPRMAHRTSGMVSPRLLTAHQIDSDIAVSAQPRRSFAAQQRAQHRTQQVTANTNLTEMQCLLCNTHATSQPDIDRHYASGRHKAMVQKLEERGALGSRGLYCGACGLICDSMQKLLAHFDTGVSLVAPEDHSKIRPQRERDGRYRCPPCGMSFIKSDLAKHLRSQCHEDGLQGKPPTEAEWGHNDGNRSKQFDRRISGGAAGDPRARSNRGNGGCGVIAGPTKISTGFNCAICGAQVFDTQAEYTAHTNAASHRQNLSALGWTKNVQPRAGVYMKEFTCGLCDIAVRGELQHQEHLRSDTHLNQKVSDLECGGHRAWAYETWDSSNVGGSEPLGIVPGLASPVGPPRQYPNTWGPLAHTDEKSASNKQKAGVPQDTSVGLPPTNGFALAHPNAEYVNLHAPLTSRNSRPEDQSSPCESGSVAPPLSSSHASPIAPSATGPQDPQLMLALFQRMLQQSEEREKVMAIKMAEMQKQIDERN